MLEVVAGCAVVDNTVLRPPLTVGKGSVTKLAVKMAVVEVVTVLIVVAGSAVVDTTVLSPLPIVGKERVPRLAVGDVVSNVVWTVVDGRFVLVDAEMHGEVI